MILIYYRDKITDQIVYHHPATGYDGLLEVKAAVDRYNAGALQRTAHAVVVKEGSLQEYLLRCADRRLAEIKTTVRDALESIRETEGLLQDCLEV